MNPYYRDESVTIWHGDCCEIMPTLGACADLAPVTRWTSADLAAVQARV